jgi:CheY-like chemotaxis protein
MMKGFVRGADRQQTTLLPECLDDWVDESGVRISRTTLVEATIVATAAEALALVREQGLRPDVLLCDYNLRGSGDGIETIGHLRAALGWNVPAAVMTGDTKSQTVDSISSQGVSVLIKPFLAEELLDVLKGQSRVPRDKDPI